MNKVNLLQDSLFDYRIVVPGQVKQTRISYTYKTRLSDLREALNDIPCLSLEEVAAILTVLSTSEDCRNQVANALGIIYDPI